MNEKDFNSMVSGLIQDKKVKEQALVRIEKEGKKTVKDIRKGFHVWILVYAILAIGYFLLK